MSLSSTEQVGVVGAAVSRLVDTLAAGSNRALAAIRTARAQAREHAWKLAGASAQDADGQVIVELDGVLVIARFHKQDARPRPRWAGEPVVGGAAQGNAGPNTASAAATCARWWRPT